MNLLFPPNAELSTRVDSLCLNQSAMDSRLHSGGQVLDGLGPGLTRPAPTPTFSSAASFHQDFPAAYGSPMFSGRASSGMCDLGAGSFLLGHQPAQINNPYMDMMCQTPSSATAFPGCSRMAGSAPMYPWMAIVGK